MCQVYNMEVEYIEKTDRVVITSLDRKLEKADSAKDTSVNGNKTFSLGQ